MKQMILLYKFLFFYFCFYPSWVGMYVNTCTEVALASGPANFYQSIWRSLPAHTSERTDSSLDIDSSRVLLTGYRYERKMSVPHPLVLTGNYTMKIQRSSQPWKHTERNIDWPKVGTEKETNIHHLQEIIMKNIYREKLPEISYPDPFIYILPIDL